VSARPDVQPFLAVMARPSRELAAALPQLAVPEATSPWSPKPEPAAPAVDTHEAETARAEARERGRAEGLAETAELRARLRALVAALATAREVAASSLAALVADVAAGALEAWLGAADRRELFEPIVRAWLAAAPSPDATAHVSPADVAVFAAVVGDAPLAIVADAALAPGDVRIQSAELELHHAAAERLPALRTAIAAALQGAGDA